MQLQLTLTETFDDPADFAAFAAQLKSFLASVGRSLTVAAPAIPSGPATDPALLDAMRDAAEVPAVPAVPAEAEPKRRRGRPSKADASPASGEAPEPAPAAAAVTTGAQVVTDTSAVAMAASIPPAPKNFDEFKPHVLEFVKAHGVKEGPAKWTAFLAARGFKTVSDVTTGDNAAAKIAALWPDMVQAIAEAKAASAK
jgi:hypothetical protein